MLSGHLHELPLESKLDPSGHWQTNCPLLVVRTEWSGQLQPLTFPALSLWHLAGWYCEPADCVPPDGPPPAATTPPAPAPIRPSASRETTILPLTIAPFCRGALVLAMTRVFRLSSWSGSSSARSWRSRRTMPCSSSGI